MRYFVGFVLALALVGHPVEGGAQPAEEDSWSSWPELEAAEEDSLSPWPELEAAPEEPVPEEPSLQLKLDEAGVGVVPPPPRTPDGFTLEEMELRCKKQTTKNDTEPNGTLPGRGSSSEGRL